jgi:HSP20 family protein
MLTHWNDFDRTFFLFDQFRRNFDRLWDEEARTADLGASLNASWPSAALFDGGSSLFVELDLAGAKEDDVEISLHDGVLAIKGTRKVETPSGYTAHRRERENLSFTRTVNIPVRIDPDKTTATMKDGVLTIELVKVPEAQPRQITVQAS